MLLAGGTTEDFKGNVLVLLLRLGAAGGGGGELEVELHQQLSQQVEQGGGRTNQCE